MLRRTALLLLLAGVLAGGCATLNQFIQPPAFSSDTGRASQLRLLGPSTTRPLGGASIRVWARVQNPNAFGLTIARLAGDLMLEGERAAELDLPLGLPLPAQRDTVIPIDLNVSFTEIPDLARALRDAVTRNNVAYRVVGTLAVDAGPLGQPSFGPSTWLNGQLQIVR